MKLKKDFVKTEAIGDTFVIVPIGEESLNNHRVITLNKTANLIYDEIEVGMDENAIAEKLAAEYEVPLEKATMDVKATIEKLIEAGVVE